MEKYLRWFDAVPLCRASRQPWVIATIIGTQGSTPRESGSKMLITEDKIYDTLGGGQLEFNVTLIARKMIKERKTQQKIEYIPLSVKAKQCCGGTVNVLFECFSAPKCHIHIFGAGHVAKALVKILGELDCLVSWVDNRTAIFPHTLPSNTQPYYYENVIDYIPLIEPNAYTVILTHDHALDYQIVTKLLDRSDCAYIGLIGSNAKAMRFKKRFKSESFSQQVIDSVTCPIGLEDVPGKHPMEVAVSIAGQLIQKMNHQTENKTQAGVFWENVMVSNSSQPAKSADKSQQHKKKITQPNPL